MNLISSDILLFKSSCIFYNVDLFGFSFLFVLWWSTYYLFPFVPWYMFTAVTVWCCRYVRQQNTDRMYIKPAQSHEGLHYIGLEVIQCQEGWDDSHKLWCAVWGTISSEVTSCHWFSDLSSKLLHPTTLLSGLNIPFTFWFAGMLWLWLRVWESLASTRPAHCSKTCFCQGGY